MSKCISCGGSFLTRGRVKLMDADICFRCFDSLGFDHKLEIASARNMYKWDEIRNGRLAYLEDKDRKHSEWLEDHPGVVEFMNILNEEDENDTATGDS